MIAQELKNSNEEKWAKANREGINSGWRNWKKDGKRDWTREGTDLLRKGLIGMW